MHVPHFEQSDIATAGAIVTLLAGAWYAFLRRNVVPQAKPVPPQASPRKREMERYAVNTPVRVLWQDEKGGHHRARAYVTDMSEYSAGLTIRTSLAAGSMIVLQSPAFNLTGAAYVRRCVRSGRRYIVGVEFKGSMIRNMR